MSISTGTCEVQRGSLQDRSSHPEHPAVLLQKECHHSWQRFQCGQLHAGTLVLWLQHLTRGRLARKPPSHMKNLLNNENINELTMFSLLYL